MTSNQKQNGLSGLLSPRLLNGLKITSSTKLSPAAQIAPLPHSVHGGAEIIRPSKSITAPQMRHDIIWR